ncbi:MAG: hypothetical protein P4M14_02100 [Gammaproteobacteria bacterium]|nr:hypothetical protein [Gammaproteobacteria bacterium]
MSFSHSTYPVVLLHPDTIMKGLEQERNKLLQDCAVLSQQVAILTQNNGLNTYITNQTQIELNDLFTKFIALQNFASAQYLRQAACDNQIQTLQNLIHDLQKQIPPANHQIKEQTESLTEVQTTQISEQSQSEKLKSLEQQVIQISELNQQQEALKQKINEQEKLLTEKLLQTSEHDQREIILTQKIQALENTVIDANLTIENLKLDLQQTQTQLHSAEKDVQSLHEQKKSWDKNRTNTANKITKLIQDNETNLATLKTTTGAEIKKLNDESQKAKSLIKQLLEQANNKKTEIANLKSDLAQYTEVSIEMEQLKRSNTILAMENMSMKQEYLDMDAEITMLQDELKKAEASKKTNLELIKENSAMKQKQVEVDAELTLQKTELQKLQQKYNDLLKNQSQKTSTPPPPAYSSSIAASRQESLISLTAESPTLFKPISAKLHSSEKENITIPTFSSQ